MYISKYAYLISVAFVVGTLGIGSKRQFQCAPTLFMFKCNEHVEMDKFLCSLACISVIDSQVYIIDSLSLDVSME